MRPIATLLFATVLAVTACTTAREAEPYAETQQRAAVVVDGGLYANAPAAKAARSQLVATAKDSAMFPRADVPASMVIRTGQASIEVDSLERAVSQVRLLAGRIGGYVANTTMQTGRGQLRSAFIEVKVPAERFDEGLAGLAPIGKLESVNVNAEDVGEEFTDVTARMGNAKRLESRLIDLLATRTGKLKDVLDVEQSLARVREEIDRYEGRIRYLKAHTAMSTLSVTVHEPLPVVGTAGKSVMGEAFIQAWRNFVVLLSLAVQSLGIVLPLGLVGFVVWIGTKRWRLRDAGVNLLAIHAFPSARRSQIDVVPADAVAFLAGAKAAGLKVSKPKTVFLVEGDDRVGAMAQLL